MQDMHVSPVKKKKKTKLHFLKKFFEPEQIRKMCHVKFYLLKCKILLAIKKGLNYGRKKINFSFFFFLQLQYNCNELSLNFKRLLNDRR